MNTHDFITLLKDTPWIGMIIGLLFFAFMFGVKNVVVFLYSRSKERHDNLSD